jgi:hypothetical protein
MNSVRAAFNADRHAFVGKINELEGINKRAELETSNLEHQLKMLE